MTIIEAIHAARRECKDIRRNDWPLYKRIEAGFYGFWRWDDSTEQYTLSPEDVLAEDWRLE